MTQHQYGILKKLQRWDCLKRMFGLKGKNGGELDVRASNETDEPITKQAEIELAGQAAAKSRPPLDGEVDIIGKE